MAVEPKRGCGYRKVGGLYLVGGRLSRPCGKIPLELDVCPTCHGGIKPTRGWTWVDPVALYAERNCDAPTDIGQGGALRDPAALGRCGLYGGLCASLVEGLSRAHRRRNRPGLKPTPRRPRRTPRGASWPSRPRTVGATPCRRCAGYAGTGR